MNSFLIGCLYRPPHLNTQFNDKLNSNMVKVSNQNKEVYLLGDFNSNILTNNPRAENLLDVTSNNDLTQLINDPTRETVNSSTAIDFIFVSHPENVVQSGVIPVAISDHYMPFCVRKCKQLKKPTRTIHIRNYKNYNKSQFQSLLQQVPWWVIETFQDPQDMLNAFVALFSDIADACAPMIHKKVKGLDTPWLTGEIRKLMSARDKLKQDAVKAKSVDMYQQYKQLKNRIIYKCKKAKQEYFSNLIYESCDNTNKLWRSIKKVLPQKTKETVTVIQDDNGTHTDPVNIANSFNSFFCRIGSDLCAKFPTGVQTQNPYPNFTQTFSFTKISSDFICRELKTLKSTKATGLDNINARLLRDAAEIVAQPLTFIMNSSLQSGMVPTSWKKARVTPIFKADSPLLPSNYRPISILPVCMKLFEKAVQKQLVSYLMKHNILCHQQSGFRTKHSTHKTAIDVTDYILQNMDKGLVTGTIYHDLQ